MTKTPEQLKQEEDMLVAHLAAGISSQIKTLDSMTMSPVSKTPRIDPRKFIPPHLVQRSNNPNNRPPPMPVAQVREQIDSSLAPRVNLIPLPPGVAQEEIIPPELKKTTEIQALQVPSAKESGNTTGQGEFNFDKQATLNEIFSHLEELKSEVKSLKFYIEDLKKTILQRDEYSDKKKSRRSSHSGTES